MEEIFKSAGKFKLIGLILTGIVIFYLNKHIHLFNLFETKSGSAKAIVILILVFACSVIFCYLVNWIVQRVSKNKIDKIQKQKKIDEILLHTKLLSMKDGEKEISCEVIEHSQHLHLLKFLYRNNLKKFTLQSLEELFKLDREKIADEILKRATFDFLSVSGNKDILKDLCEYKLIILKNDEYMVDDLLWDKLK